MRQYLELAERIIDTGAYRDNRTEIDAYSIFGHQMRFDLQEGFPVLTTKRVFHRGAFHELLWMISGSTRTDYLVENKVHIWDEWAAEKYRPELGYAHGELGPVYPAQWRRWSAPNVTPDVPGAVLSGEGPVIDQLALAVHKLRENPHDRRNIVCSWNVAEIHLMKLPPCHLLYQFYVANGRLSTQVYVRSWDVFLGAPFNIAFYALLTHMMAQVSGLEVGELVMTSGDTHLYANHIPQIQLQLSRKPKPLPTLELDPSITEVGDFRFEHIALKGYLHHPPIEGEVAV